jgi:hypothetical protein
VNNKTYEALSKISDDEWREIALDLERHALSKSRNLRWRTRSTLELPGGETVNSIVSAAIEKVFSGERNWDPEKDPDIKRYLRAVIDSLINHLVESPDNVLVRAAPQPGTADYVAWEKGSRQRDPTADWLVPPDRSPEAELLREKDVALEDRALDMLVDECSGDAVAMAVLEAMMDGYGKPAEISKQKDIPVEDIYNAIKRLDRKLEIIRNRLAEEQGASAPGKEIA